MTICTPSRSMEIRALIDSLSAAEKGEALQKLGRKDDAVTAYRHSLTLKPASHIRERAVEGLKALGVDP